MSLNDFKNIYGRLSVASDLCDEHEGTLRGLQSAAALESILENATGEKVNLKEDSARTRQAEVAIEFRERFKREIIDYTKINLDNIFKESDPQNIIRAASLGIQHNPENTSDLAKYLYAYMAIEHLKEEEESMQGQNEHSRKRKKRLTGEQRSKLTQSVLPLIVKERIREKVPGKDLDFYAFNIAYVAALSDRDYVANAIRDGQELLGKRIKDIGGVDKYIKDNLKEEDDYLSFARSLGEAYEKASKSEAH